MITGMSVEYDIQIFSNRLYPTFYEFNDMISTKYYQVFRFEGTDKRHKSKLIVELPLKVRKMQGKNVS